MKKFIYLFLILSFSCEKDDVCSENTQTTPRIVLEFYNLEAPDDTLDVPELLAVGLDNENMMVPITNELIMTRSMIALPLKTDDTQATFILFKNYNVEEGVVTGNPDTITITYQTNDVYVSRACGYKTNFDVQTFSIIEDADQWMSSSDIILREITNENEIHVKILH